MTDPNNPRHARTGRHIDLGKLDQVVANARQARDARAAGYRDQALKLYPWVCGRCGRHFGHENLRELTVHHKDMDHDNNPADGSNWELLCLYCHDNEHQKYEEHLAAITAGRTRGGASGALPGAPGKTATHKPFGDLADLLKGGD
jgi:hypothetical protein